MAWQRIEGTVTCGHGVASGACGDPRFPEGTVALQVPLFREHGIDLSPFFPGTLNVSIAPRTYEVIAPKATVRDLDWSPHSAREDFSFFDCRVRVSSADPVEALVYRPHPETKPEHFQPPDVFEILAPFVEGLAYGDRIAIEIDEAQLKIV